MATMKMRFPGGRPKALTFSYDDAVEQDIRLVEIFNKYGLKGTFNINTGSFAPEGKVYPEGQVHRRMSEKQVYELFKDSPHEVAVHTLTHPFLEQLPIATAAYEVLGDKMNIEKMFGTITRGMAYPFGTYSDAVISMLKGCGIAYSRDTVTTSNFDLPDNWLAWKGTCHHRNPNLMSLAEKFIKEQPKSEAWLFYVWGHSYEFEQCDNWNVIEAFAERMANNKEIWYATNIEIHDYIAAQRQLRISADETILQNPTAIDVWVEKDSREIIHIPAGQTVQL